METTEQVTMERAALNEMEQRGLRMNAQIYRIVRRIAAGDAEGATSLAWLLQEANCQQMKALVAAGAVDSLAANASTVWDDDEPPVDVETLDLGALRSEFGAAPE